MSFSARSLGGFGRRLHWSWFWELPRLANGKYQELKDCFTKRSNPPTLTKHMFVLGIDPGLTTTGYGAVRRAGGRSEAVAVGVIRTDKDLPVARRLLELHRDLEGLLVDIKPDVVALEQVFVNRNLSTATNVGRASGVVLLAAAAAGLEVFEYSPSAVKATVTGDGRAEKRQVQDMVARRLGLAVAPSPADAADALAIALCHLQSPMSRPRTGVPG